MADGFSALGPAVGFLELGSIARGIEATDAMLKRAHVDLLSTAIVARGKYLVMVGGAVADVEQAVLAGIEIGGASVLDRFIIQNAHPELPAAIKGRVRVQDVEAVGVIETREVASAIFAADAAVKAAPVRLVEARHQPGGKGLVVLGGEVGAVREAMMVACATVTGEGMLVSQVVIPFAHRALLGSLTSSPS